MIGETAPLLVSQEYLLFQPRMGWNVYVSSLIKVAEALFNFQFFSLQLLSKATSDIEATTISHHVFRRRDREVDQTPEV